MAPSVTCSTGVRYCECMRWFNTEGECTKAA
jgi:hypothetical protein